MPEGNVTYKSGIDSVLLIPPRVFDPLPLLNCTPEVGQKKITTKNAVQKKAMTLYEAGYGSTTIGQKLNVHQRIIREWILRYKLRGENGFVKLKSRIIPVEEKIRIIKLLKEKCSSCEVAAITYGYSKSSVLKWLRIVDSEGYDGLYIRKKRERMKKIKKQANITKEDLNELYVKLEWLEAENALLKKVKALVEAEEARLRANGQKPSKN